MKLELKRVEFSERMSEETNCFVADLWVNGKKVAHCTNDGRGGETYYHAHKGQLDILKQAEDYCKSLPKIKYGEHEWDSDLTWVIDDLLTKHLEKKAYAKSLVYKTAKGVHMEMSWAKGWTVTKLLKSESGRKAITKAITRLKSEGCTIQNTNLGALLD